METIKPMSPEALAIIEEVKKQNEQAGHVGTDTPKGRKRLICAYDEMEFEGQINTISLREKFRENHFLAGQKTA